VELLHEDLQIREQPVGDPVDRIPRRRGQFFPVDILEEELRFLIGVLGSSSGILSGEVES
jgi:hypothetical protein